GVAVLLGLLDGGLGEQATLGEREAGDRDEGARGEGGEESRGGHGNLSWWCSAGISVPIGRMVARPDPVGRRPRTRVRHPGARCTRVGRLRSRPMTTIPPDLDADRGKTLRAPVILDLLAEAHPDARIALDFSSTWELLVATVLSAQSTDVKVNEVTPRLFAELPGPEAFAEAGVERTQELISSLGLFRQKAKNLHATAVLLLERHGG